MIDEHWTWEFYGYHSDDLSYGSKRSVVVRCDDCCKYRIVQYRSYRDLCASCCKKGELGSFFGKHHTDAVKKRLAESGAITSSGRKHSEETKQKMSKSHMGHSVSEKTIRKLIERNKKVMSAETRQKISEANMGNVVSAETRQKISKALTGIKRSEAMRQNMSRVRRGEKRSDEAKQHMSAGHQHIPYDEWTQFTNKNRPHLTPHYKCIKMNKWFVGCDAHHITPTIVAYIPTELHRHIRHNITTGSNMGEMNVLAVQFINDGLQIDTMGEKDND